MNKKVLCMPSLLSQNRMYFFGLVFIFFVIVGLLFLDKEKINDSLTGAEIGGQRYYLEIADTDIKREKGLGERESLCNDCGMLFVFDTEGQYVFWMKDMRFSIDIIWLLGDKVVFVARNISPEFRDILKPQVVANKVLEINADKGKDIYIGEEIHFE